MDWVEVGGVSAIGAGALSAFGGNVGGLLRCTQSGEEATSSLGGGGPLWCPWFGRPLLADLVQGVSFGVGW